jgi:hypothetical protein
VFCALARRHCARGTTGSRWQGGEDPAREAVRAPSPTTLPDGPTNLFVRDDIPHAVAGEDDELVAATARLRAERHRAHVRRRDDVRLRSPRGRESAPPRAQRNPTQSLEWESARARAGGGGTARAKGEWGGRTTVEERKRARKRGQVRETINNRTTRRTRDRG